MVPPAPGSEKMQKSEAPGSRAARAMCPDRPVRAPATRVASVTLPRPPRPARLLYAVGLAALLPVAGCAGQGSADDSSAAAAALRFTHDLATSPSEACGLLAPQTLKELEDSEGACPSSLPGLDLPRATAVRSTEVYAKDAIVRLDKDTLFLARFDQGWRVTAAGCTPHGDLPYDCTVKGG